MNNKKAVFIGLYAPCSGVPNSASSPSRAEEYLYLGEMYARGFTVAHDGFDGGQGLLLLTEPSTIPLEVLERDTTSSLILDRLLRIDGYGVYLDPDPRQFETINKEELPMNSPSQTGTTKVTFEFPNGKTQVFDTIGFVGSFILNQSANGAQLGAFATGKFTPSTIAGAATGAIEALAKEMMNQGMAQHEVENVFLQILPHAIGSAAIREVSEQIEQVEQKESANNDLVRALEALVNMYK